MLSQATWSLSHHHPTLNSSFWSWSWDCSSHHNNLSASQSEPRNPFSFLKRLFFKGSSVRGPWILVMVRQLPSVALSLSICQVSRDVGTWSSWLLQHKALALLLGPLLLILPLIPPIWRPHSHMKSGMQLPQKGVLWGKPPKLMGMRAGLWQLWGRGRGPATGCCHLPLQHLLQSHWSS